MKDPFGDESRNNEALEKAVDETDAAKSSLELHGVVGADDDSDAITDEVYKRAMLEPNRKPDSHQG